MKKMILLFLCVAIGSAIDSHAQSGGNFTITRSVIAAGGLTAGGGLNVDGAIGQPIITRSQGGSFLLSGGFWPSGEIAPTSAMVSVEGRALTSDGRPIYNAQIALVAMDGTARLARTNPFGFYRFDDVAAGQDYVMTIIAKSFTFQTPTILIWVMDELTGIDFIADQ